VTFTVDAVKDGVYYEDHGVTAAQVAQARANAPRLGITIIAVTEETPVDAAALAAFGAAGVAL
jgi:hypothetical protein